MPHPPTSPPPGQHAWQFLDFPRRLVWCNGCGCLKAAQGGPSKYCPPGGNWSEREPACADLATLAARAEREQERLAALATWDDARVAQRAAWQRTRTPFGPTTYQQAHDATMLASEALNALCVLLDQQRAAGAVAAPGGSARGE